MRLEDSYYQIVRETVEGREGRFRIRLLPDCPVYRGHFPGNPVSPGVCNIRTIQECACRVAGERLFIATIKRCRLTALVSPAICPELDVEVRLSPADTSFTVEARMTEAGVTYVEYTGEMRSAVEGR